MKKLLFLLVIAAAITVAYNLLIYYDNDFMYGRMRETPAVRPYEKPIFTMESGIVPLQGGDAIYRAASAESLSSPINLNSPAVIQEGKNLYFTYCHQCHGKYYDGNATVGQSFAPLPTDLRSARVQNFSEGYLFKHITFGGGRAPALGTTIREQDRWRIVAFLKSLGIRQ